MEKRFIHTIDIDDNNYCIEDLKSCCDTIINLIEVRHGLYGKVESYKFLNNYSKLEFNVYLYPHHGPESINSIKKGLDFYMELVYYIFKIKEYDKDNN